MYYKMLQNGSYILFQTNIGNSKAIPFEVESGTVVARNVEEFTDISNVINGSVSGERKRAIILPRTNVANRPSIFKPSDPPDNSLRTPIPNARTIRLHDPNFPRVPIISRDRVLATIQSPTVTHTVSPIWAATIDGPGDDQGSDICTDSSGNVFITGYYTGSGCVAYNSSGVQVFDMKDTSGNAMFVAKYDSNGSPLWTASIDCSTNDQGFGICTDNTGDVYITGFYSGSNGLAYNSSGISVLEMRNAVGNAGFVAKYAGADGTPLWVASIDGSSDDRGNGICTDSSGEPLS